MIYTVLKFVYILLISLVNPTLHQPIRSSNPLNSLSWGNYLDKFLNLIDINFNSNYNVAYNRSANPLKVACYFISTIIYKRNSNIFSTHEWRALLFNMIYYPHLVLHFTLKGKIKDHRAISDD